MGLDTQPPYVTAVGAVFLALCPIVVALRFYARRRHHAGLGIDDWLTLPALLMVIGCALDVIIGVRLRAYAYPTVRGPSALLDYVHATKLSWAFSMLQIWSMGLIKLSFVFFFRRIFVEGRSKGIANVTSLTVASIIVSWTLAFFFWVLFACGTHFSARWGTRAEAVAYCPTVNKSGLALAISDVLTDVMVLCLPIPNILQLKMKTGRKIEVLAVFGLGALALVASVIRLAILVHVNKGASTKIVDIKLLITQGSYWPTLESGLALIACCLPVLNSFRKPVQDGRIESPSRFSQIHTPLWKRPTHSAHSSIDTSTAVMKGLDRYSATKTSEMQYSHLDQESDGQSHKQLA